MLSGRSSSRRAEVCLRFCHSDTLWSVLHVSVEYNDDLLIFNMRLILAYIQAIKCAREAIVLYCGSLTMPERQSEAPGLLTKAALHCIAAGVQQHSVLMKCNALVLQMSRSTASRPFLRRTGTTQLGVESCCRTLL